MSNWAVLRGSRETGYRTTVSLECPHCSRPVDVAGRADADKQGPHLVLWTVATPGGGYTRRELDHVINGPKGDTGVVMPTAPQNAPFKDDPVPDFSGARPEV